MDTKLIETENEAIESISKYMIDWLNGRIQYVQKKRAEGAKATQPHITKKAASFWDDCVTEFQRYAESLTDSTGDDLDYDDSVIWRDCFDGFEESYAEIKETYGFSKIEEKEFDELFQTLFGKMKEAARNIDGPHKISLVKRLEIKYLSHMLDVNNSAVCELLPYLLTAYVFNSWDSRFFYENSKDNPLIPTIFEGNDIFPADANKLRERIKKFADNFRLGPHIDKLIKPKAHCRPSVGFRGSDIKVNLGIRNSVLLDNVFKKWCDIVQKYAKKHDIKKISTGLSIAHSQTLYDYYTK